MRWPWQREFPKATYLGQDADARIAEITKAYVEMWTMDYGRLNRAISKATGLSRYESLVFMCLHEFALIRTALFDQNKAAAPVLAKQDAALSKQERVLNAALKEIDEEAKGDDWRPSA